MRLVLTVLARDEADVIEAMLDCHYALGVDFVIATDNRSVDGTTEALERYQRQGRLRLIHEPADDYDQGRWVTRMARLAAAEYGADWVINADADEWWWPREGNLRSALAGVPAHASMVAARRYNFVIRPDDDRPFHERMRWRRSDSLTHDGVPMGVKVCHRAHPSIEVAVGNHSVAGLDSHVLDDGCMEILHFPLRSLGQYERKIRLGAAALERNASFSADVGHHWRRAAAAGRDGRLADDWASWVYDDERLAAALASGEVVTDERVANLVGAHRAGRHVGETHGPPDCHSTFTRQYGETMSSSARPVRRIGAGVSYADGAEDDVLAVLRKVGDTSSGSVELGKHIVDWPTRYHFSHQRSHLLRPLRIAPGTRVLDVGAGSGALARYAAEQGADVVALEGNPSRAEAAAERCRDLDNVEVLCGTLVDLDPSERFDLVLLVGVLEYAASAIGGRRGATEMLRRTRAHLRDGGAAVIAIENQLGLKYLLGAREDHLGIPWVGIDGYPGPPGVRTWNRRGLAALLAEAGLPQQRWLAPFPDYKLPRVILDEQLYAHADAPELIEQLVLEPVVCLDQPPVRLADAAAAHRVFIEAGLAADVVNSFLVVAGPEGVPLSRVVPSDTLAWLFGGHRVPPWQRERRLTSAFELITVGDDRPRRVGWLGQDPGRSRAFLRGRTLQQDALDAARAHDLDALGRVLRRWRRELESRSVPIDSVADGGHPFLLADSVLGLPDGHLDVGLANFVHADGALVLIDDEWRTDHPVDVRVAEYRALWVLAREIVGLGASNPWGDRATIDDIVGYLLALAGSGVESHVVEAWRSGEAELQRLVAGATTEELFAGWLDGSLRTADLDPQDLVSAELEKLRAEVPRLHAEIAAVRAECQRLADERAEFLGQRDHLEGVVAAQQAQLEHVKRPRGFLGHQLRRNRLARAVATLLGRTDRATDGA